MSDDDTPEAGFGPARGSASLLVGRKGEIELASPRAYALLFQFSDVGLGAGTQIYKPGMIVPPPLLKLIDRVEAIEAGVETLPPRIDRRTPYGLVSARAYAMGPPGQSAGRDRIAIMIESRPYRELAVLEKLAREELTPAERKVAFELAMDREAADAIRRLGITYETWRDYRKRVYRALGVNSRAALVRMLH